MSHASITIVGRLGQDAELSKNGNALNFSLAVNRFEKKDEDKVTDWYKCVLFGNAIETGRKYFLKGIRLVVSGEPTLQKYVDKDGANRIQLQIKVRTFNIIDFKDQSGESKVGHGSAPEPQQQSNQLSGFDDDLPF